MLSTKRLFNAGGEKKPSARGGDATGRRQPAELRP